MDVEQKKVYDKMQRAALVAMALFAVGLFSLSYWLSPSHFSTPYMKSSTSDGLRVWPASSAVQPAPSGLTLISFWAAWCEPCLREIPEIQKFVVAFPELTLHFVNTDQMGTEMYAEAQKLDLIHPGHQVNSFFDSKNKLKNQLGLSGIPTHYLVRYDRSILWTATGVINWDQKSIADLFGAFIDSEKQMVQEPIEN